MKLHIVTGLLTFGTWLASVVQAEHTNHRAEIANLGNRYMVALDAGDIETVMGCWTQDGKLEWAGGEINGHDEIREALTRKSAESPLVGNSVPRPTRHRVISREINRSGELARSTASWFALTDRVPGGNPQLLFMGHFEDELTRIDGKWLLKSRRVINEPGIDSRRWVPGLGDLRPYRHKSRLVGFS